MRREIYEVYAKVLDANGAYNTLSGYPKVFDSRQYSNDPDKALLRAQGEVGTTFGTMSKRDDRQMQTVMLINPSTGKILESRVIGKIPDDPGEVIPET